MYTRDYSLFHKWPHVLLITALLPLIGCSLFQKRGSATDDSTTAPSESGSARRVVVQFHLAADSPVEGRVQMPVAGGGVVFVDQTPALSQLDVETARAYHGDSGSIVEITLNFEGRHAMADLTRTHVGERLAILIDGELHSAPRIMGEVTDGRAFISHLSRGEAESVAASLTR